MSPQQIQLRKKKLRQKGKKTLLYDGQWEGRTLGRGGGGDGGQRLVETKFKPKLPDASTDTELKYLIPSLSVHIHSKSNCLRLVTLKMNTDK